MLFTLFILPYFFNICFSRAVDDGLSSNCSNHRDSVVIGHCVRPWIDIWEMTRQHEAANSDLVYPLLYYSRDEILGLCEVYENSRSGCLDDNVISKCEDHPLIKFIQSHMAFICGQNSVETLAQFECISSATRRKKQCRDYLKGLAIPGLDKNKCTSMPQFYNCIRFEVEGRCGLVGLNVLKTAITNFKCDYEEKLDQNVEELGLSTEIEYTYVDSAAELERSTSKAISQEETTAKSFINFNQLGQFELDAGGDSDITSAASPIPIQVDTLVQCTEEKAVSVSQCLSPLLDLWNQMRDNQPEVNHVAFPLYKYNTKALLDLCDMYARVEDDCVQPGDMHACIQQSPVKFVYSLFGYACGQQETDFFLSFDCISMVTRNNGHCMDSVKGETVPGKMDTRCKGVSDYYLCMEPLVMQRCESQSLRVFRKSIQHFGCSVPSIVPKKEHSPDFLKSEDDQNRIDQLVEKVEPDNHFPIDVSKSEEDLLAEEDEVSENVLLDAPPKLPLQHSRHVPKHLLFGNQCSSEMRLQVRHCLVPLMSTWRQLKSSQQAVNEIRFPIYTYAPRDILEMCDQYANAFLACPFDLFESCLQDEVVRFANNMMGYICSPQNLASFMRNFECVASVFQSRPPCTKPLLGSVSPGQDHDRCIGMSQFLSCSSDSIAARCGDRSLAELKTAIIQFGCDV